MSKSPPIHTSLYKALKNEPAMTSPNTNIDEQFLPVKGYEGLYEVSNTGKVRSLPRKTSKGGLLKQTNRGHGYMCVSLSNGKSKMYHVHRLVATAFISNPENKRTVNHKDGVRTNNGVSNLEWSTHSEQAKHSYDVLGRVNANHPSRRPANYGEGVELKPCRWCGNPSRPHCLDCSTTHKSMYTRFKRRRLYDRAEYLATFKKEKQQ
jgi:hypothetical protein